MPLSPLPSPSHRPGEGDSSEAVVTIGCLFVALPILKPFPTATIASTAFPSPGRREGDGRGDRGEVSEGRTPQRPRCSGEIFDGSDAARLLPHHPKILIPEQNLIQPVSQPVDLVGQ